MKPINAITDSSDWKIVKKGVPQHSVLGQLLCNMYIKYFPGLINSYSDVIVLAHDISILISSTNHDELNLNFNCSDSNIKTVSG
jgi:hypothetical protein